MRRATDGDHQTGLLERLGLLAGAAALVGASAGTLVSATARSTHWGEIVVNGSAYLGLAACGAGLVFLSLRRVAWMAVSLALALYHFAPVAELYLSGPRGVMSGPTVDVATLNLLYDNDDADKFVDWVVDARPSVLGALEVTPFWRAVFERPELTRLYPHRLAEPERESGFWMVLLSQLPISNAHVHETPYAWRSFLEADVDVDGFPLHVVLVHPSRPGLGWGTHERNAYLMHVAQGTTWREHSVLLGDFNATLWSPLYQDVVAETGLFDSRRGFGWLPTWRSEKHLSGIWLDLDHILVGSGIGVIDRAVGEDVGSDHRPATARLQLNEFGVERTARTARRHIVERTQGV